MSAKKEPKPIEYEQLNLKLPKACLMYLNENVKNPDAWLERALVDEVRAEYEANAYTVCLADEMGLSPVFWELLKDRRYHPNINKRVPMQPATEEPKT